MILKEFYIHKIQYLGTSLVFDGRICKGTLKVDDVFNFLAKVVSGDSEGQISTEEKVATFIKVVSMQAYEHSFQELDEGMTCRLVVEADKIKFLEEDYILYQEDYPCAPCF